MSEVCNHLTLHFYVNYNKIVRSEQRDSNPDALVRNLLERSVELPIERPCFCQAPKCLGSSPTPATFSDVIILHLN